MRLSAWYHGLWLLFVNVVGSVGFLFGGRLCVTNMTYRYLLAFRAALMFLVPIPVNQRYIAIFFFVVLICFFCVPPKKKLFHNSHLVSTLQKFALLLRARFYCDALIMILQFRLVGFLVNRRNKLLKQDYSLCHYSLFGLQWRSLSGNSSLT